jgi:hypothetical protein
MNLISLFLFILLPTGTYEAGSVEFPTKEACEPARQALIVKALGQGTPWLISQCGERDEPVNFRMFMNENAIQQGGTAEPEPWADPSVKPIRPRSPKIDPRNGA